MKCIVIGGGIAGLIGARDLAKNDWDVTLIEARARLGGRILTTYSQGVAIELGPEFIHGNPQETFELLDDKEHETVKLEESQEVYWQQELHEAQSLWDQIEKFSHGLKMHDPDISMREEIEKFKGPPRTKALIDNFVEGFNAAYADEMSAAAFKQENARAPKDALEASRLLSGYTHLVRKLENELRKLGVRILLESRVTEVRWQQGRVSAEIAPLGENALAEAMLITLPTPHFNLEATNPLHISFSPDILKHRQAAKQLPLGPVHKLVLVFRKPLWPRTPGNIHFVHSPELPFGARWSWDWENKCVITSWSGGRRADHFKNKKREEILGEALQELALITGKKDISAELEEWHYHDWIHDEHSLGAYSYVKVGGQNARDELAKPVDRTLFFAGEATMSDGSAGTVHGAIRSAHRAAEEILKSFA